MPFKTKTARNAAQRKRRHLRPTPPLDQRNAYLQWAYGMSLDDFKLLEITQGGVCQVCKNPPSGRGPSAVLHVDHDHATGKIRGLLCLHCNTAMGNADDSADRLRALASYLDLSK